MKQFELEVQVKCLAKEFWRVWVKNVQDTLPKAVQHHTSVVYLDGPPLAVGGVTQVNYDTERESSLSITPSIPRYAFNHFK